MIKKIKKEIAFYLGRFFPITIKQGLSKGMKVYGDVFYNRIDRPLDHGDYFYQALKLEGACVFEIGSHMGQYTVYFSKRIGSGMLYAIEPNPINYETLCRTLLKNRCKNVISINKGVSNVEGELLFMSDRYNRATGTFNTEQQTKISAKYHDSNLMKIRISVTTLSHIFIEHNVQKADFVKIDTEGYELQVIEGMKTILRDFKPVILFETHGSRLSKQHDFRRIASIFFDANYFVISLTHGLREITKGTVDQYGDGAFIAFAEEKIGVTDAMSAVKKISFGPKHDKK